MMRIFFAGTPACAIPSLKIIAEKYPIAGILTAPPAPAGRGKKYSKSAVAAAADLLKSDGILAEYIPVMTPEKLDTAFRTAVSALKPDILVCFAFGRIFGPKMLALFPRGAVNIHPSLLPRWRGPSPVPAAIAAGDTVTGVTVQYLAQEMDTGDIIIQKKLPVDPHDTAETLLTRCSGLGAELIIDALAQLEAGTVRALPQDNSSAVYCRLLQKSDGIICWHDTAAVIDRKIRACTPWPGAFCHWKDSKLAILHAHPYTGNAIKEQPSAAGLILGTDKKEGILVQTGEGILALQILQREAKKAMQWKDFLNGVSGFIGTYLEE